MVAKALFKREEELARVYGTRKVDVLLQSLRCPECGAEGLRRRRYVGMGYGDVAAVEKRMLQAIARRFDSSCRKCETGKLQGDGRAHMYALYSDAERSHLVVHLGLTREDDGRVRVRRRCWIVPLDGTSQPIEEDDERLHAWWLESRVRQALQLRDEASVRKAFVQLADQGINTGLVLREHAHFLLESGLNAEALAIMQKSLAEDPEQPELLRRAALLYAGYGNPGAAADLFVRAHDLIGGDTVLPDLIRAAYQARRYGMLQVAADQLLERDPENLLALKALVCCQSASRIRSLQGAWQSLARAAEAAGDRTSAHAGRRWSEMLGSAIPDWEASLSARAYARSLAESLENAGCDVETSPSPLIAGDANIPCDLEFTTPEGDRYVVFLIAGQVRTHVERTLRAAFAALAADPERTGARPLPLSVQPLPWAIMRYAAGDSVAALDLGLDADTTLSAHTENIATMLWAAERYFGMLLDFTPDSLRDVDAILERYHESGLGSAGFPLQCAIASYVGEVVLREVEGAAWKDGDAEMDPRLIQLPGGGEVNVLGKIGKYLRNGSEDSVYHFATTAIELADSAEPTDSGGGAK